jgi:hypothetical protein
LEKKNKTKTKKGKIAGEGSTTTMKVVMKMESTMKKRLTNEEDNAEKIRQQ